jgi:Large polyvalent protein associated domain 38
LAGVHALWGCVLYVTAYDLKALGFKQKIARARVIDVVQDFNASVEDATKMTTYRRLREAGYSEKAAAWETRRYGGGPDFARQGNLTPAINLASMFFNAHLQYVSRVFSRAWENPGRVAVALGAITAMAMTLNEHNQQQKDEKGNQLMRKVPYTDRENNFVVLTGDTYQSSSGATLPVYYKVPKNSFVKFLYNPIENMLNKIAGNEERSGTQLGLQALGNLSPGQMDLQEGQVGKSASRGIVSSLNPVIRTPLEEAMNYKTTGFGMPIVPGREANIDPQYQYGPGTSETAKRIGQGGVPGAVAGASEGGAIGYLLGGPKGAAIGGGLGTIAGTFGVSPRRAEHIIDTTTAGVGRIATGFVDPFLGGVKQTRMEGPEKLANTPVAGPIMGRFISTSVDQQEAALTNQFYQQTQAAQEPLNTMRFLEKNHPEQVPAYIQAHKDELWKGQVATTMQSRLGQIQSAERTIQQNQGMNENDRAAALKNLHDVKLQVLKVFNDVIKPSPSVPQAWAMPGQGQGSPR